jgi:hypothetical protein
VKAAMEILGLSRSSYYPQVREVALKRVEAGDRRVRAYAMAWGKLSQDSHASSRMSCYRVLERD